MEIVGKYYAQKARTEINDEFLDHVSESDLGIMRKAFGYVLIAPLLSIGVMYAAKKAKQDVSMTQSFVQSIRKVQDSIITADYSRGRTSSAAEMPEGPISGGDSKRESENLGNLYKVIKDKQKADKDDKV